MRPRQGTAICNFGAPSPLDFFECSPVDSFPLSPGSLCTLVRKSPQNVENIAEKGAESCHVSGCHGFFSVLNYLSSEGLAGGGRRQTGAETSPKL